LTDPHRAGIVALVPGRTFTPEEANDLLAEVRPLVERMVERRADLLAARARQAEVAAQVGGNGGGMDPRVPATLAEAATEAESGLHAAVRGLLELGVQVKDPDSGLVDFPSEREGEPVLLCWQLGEERVAFWHGLEDGFAGRQPL
jgi:hypothetical protein